MRTDVASGDMTLSYGRGLREAQALTEGSCKADAARRIQLRAHDRQPNRERPTAFRGTPHAAEFSMAAQSRRREYVSFAIVATVLAAAVWLARSHADSLK